MIIRYPLKCDDCHSITMLRLGVSGRSREPFSFACGECQRKVSGIHSVDQKKFKNALEDLKGASRVDGEDEGKFTVTYHPDFAGTVGPGAELGFSPFLDAMMRKGMGLPIKMAGVSSFYDVLDNDLPQFAGIVQNFLGERWDPFGKAVAKYLPDSPLELMVDRQKALFQLLELILMPIVSSEPHAKFVVRMNEYLTECEVANKKEFETFLKEVIDEGWLGASRRDLLAVLVRFLENAEEFRSILPFWEPADGETHIPTDLLVTAPKSFHELKSLYVDTYEAVARGLTLILGIQNLHDRGGRNSFPLHPKLGKKYEPRSLSHLHGMSNAPKLGFLSDADFVGSWLLPAMDPKLRNAIGHNSARFNQASGEIEFEVDKAGTIRTISYAEFLFGILQLVRAALRVAHIAKQLFIRRYFRDEGWIK